MNPIRRKAEDYPFSLNCNGRLLPFDKAVVMGILNLSPDSFFDGGTYRGTDAVIRRVEQMIAEGAGVIDVGACSTRPGAKNIGAGEELKRLLPALKELRVRFPDTIFSVDTYHAAVAEQAIEAGADIINDISGGTMDELMFGVAAKHRTPYILTHIQGKPEGMQQNPVYSNVIEEVRQFFAKRIRMLNGLGVYDIVLDPGFGFGKTIAHNYQLLKSLANFSVFGLPVLAGISRKSMINGVLNLKASEAMNGSTVLHTIALLNGASMLRVHDVKEAVEAVKLVAFYSEVMSYEL